MVTIRKNAFLNSFSPSKNGIYVKIDNFHKCHLCQCQENFKATLTYIYVKVFFICGITYVIGYIAYVNVGHNTMLRLLMKYLILFILIFVFNENEFITID